MTLGERIIFIRGDTAREKFAPLLGISKNTLIFYEKDERCPGADVLNTILELFPDINPTWLLTGEGNMQRGSAISEGEGPELDLALMEKIIIETIKGQRITGDEAQDIAITGLARMTASAIINQYRDCVGMPTLSINQIINRYNCMLSSLNEQLTAVADKRGV